MGRKRGRRRSPFKLKIPTDILFSIGSLVLMLMGLLILVSFTGQGKLLSDIFKFLESNFGWTMLFLPPLFILSGLILTKLNWKISQPNVLLGGVLLFIALMGTTKAGGIGSEIYTNLAVLIQPIGAILIFFGVGLTGIMIMSETSIDEFLVFVVGIFKGIAGLFSRSGEKKVAVAKEAQFADIQAKGIKIKGGRNKTDQPVDAKPGEIKTNKANLKLATPEEAGLSKKPIITEPGSEKEIFQLPPLDILVDEMGGEADRGDIKKNADIIENTLNSFGIQARVVEVNLGPAVTQYALQIALGTKLSKITALQNDLALALAAPSQIRIEAPIPGKSLVGIELPNKTPEMVTLKQMLLSQPMTKSKSKLAVALGLNVSGEAVIADIGKMPHVLIAGSTGSGKSVSVNAMIASILYRATPEEVKFIMVDPKRVELTGYNGIPHLLTPVIVEPDKVLAALEWAVNEMDNRYKLFAEVGVRNISNYNELSGFQSMPYLVIIIDELADIMLFAPAKVEEAITRLAQMARATGIHLVLATQRPSVDVLTGLIKANIPCRISFNVTSIVDSRVIIDSTGAEKLLGKGDMLYVPPDQAKPSRIQGTYVSDAEIKGLIDYLKSTIDGSVEYTDEVTTKYAPTTVPGVGGEDTEVDEFFADAVRVVVESDKASASYLQRRLSVGYARAARILDQLEAAGVVSAADGAKPRNVLITSAEEFLNGSSA